ENLGAEILRPVRPAYPAARHFAEAQMHRFQPRRIKKDLVERTRRRDSVELAAGELDGKHLFWPRIAAPLEKIGGYRRRDRTDEIANDAIFIEAVDCWQRGFDGRQDFMFATRARVGGQGLTRIEARIKKLDGGGSDRRVLAQRRPQIILRIGN